MTVPWCLRRPVACSALVAGLALLASEPSQAAEGGSLSIRSSPSGGGAILLRLRSSTTDSGNFESDGDPRCAGLGGGGAVLRVRSAAGNDLAIPLPCTGWTTPNGSPTSTFNTDYTYRDTSGATCRSVVVKHGHSLRASCRGLQVAFPLAGPQGQIDVELSLGTLPIRNCASFGAPPSEVQSDGSNGRSYRARGVAPVAGCPAP